MRLVISTSKYGRRSVAAGPTVTSQESSLLTVEGEAAYADVAKRSRRDDSLFLVEALRQPIDVRSFAERGRAVRQRRSGRTDEHTAGGGDHRANADSRRTAVAERCGVELGDQMLRAEAAEHRDRYPVLARTRTRCARSREDARAAKTGDDRCNATDAM